MANFDVNEEEEVIFFSVNIYEPQSGRLRVLQEEPLCLLRTST